MENNSVNTDIAVVDNAVNEMFTDKQQKTTFSLRLTREQRDIIGNYQGLFLNQTEFANHIIACLQNGSVPSPDDPNILKMHVTQLDKALLKYVAERESTEKIVISPEHILMYMFDEMFIKGNKFSIDAIPDSVIRKYRKEFVND